MTPLRIILNAILVGAIAKVGISFLQWLDWMTPAFAESLSIAIGFQSYVSAHTWPEDVYLQALHAIELCLIAFAVICLIVIDIKRLLKDK